MIENSYGSIIENNVGINLARSSIPKPRNDVVPRRTSPCTTKKFCWKIPHILHQLFLIQILLVHREVVGGIYPIPHQYGLPFFPDSYSVNQASEAINPLSSRYSNPPFEPSLNIGHPLTSGYARNEEESNTKKLLTDIDYEDVPNPEAYKILHLSSKTPPINYGAKKDEELTDKKLGQEEPNLVHFKGTLVGDIDLNEVDDIHIDVGEPQKRRNRRSSFHHTPFNKVQLKHLLRSALPSKRILFNEIVLNHAPDLRKNESAFNDPRYSTPSPSDKASRYFIDLQHLRKKFWERYRHLLIPMIRKQAQKSGIKRVENTATSLGLRQTKRSSKETFSDIPFNRQPPFMQQNGVQTPKRNNIGRFILSTYSDKGEDEKVSYLAPMASWKTRSFRPTRAKITKKWQQGRNIKKWDETSQEPDDPNRNFDMTRWQRFGRSSGAANSVKTAPISKRSKAPEQNKDGDISMMHYLAYSLLYDRRYRRSSKLEEVPALSHAIAKGVNELIPESAEEQELLSKVAESQNEDDDMEGMYLQLLNEILKEKALTNRRTNQSKLRLL